MSKVGFTVAEIKGQRVRFHSDKKRRISNNNVKTF
jgi:hypothetical protein